MNFQSGRILYIRGLLGIGKWESWIPDVGWRGRAPRRGRSRQVDCDRNAAKSAPYAGQWATSCTPGPHRDLATWARCRAARSAPRYVWATTATSTAGRPHPSPPTVGAPPPRPPPSSGWGGFPQEEQQLQSTLHPTLPPPKKCLQSPSRTRRCSPSFFST